MYTHSSIVTYRECPRKYWWSYVRRVAPWTVSGTLELGTLYHEGMELLLRCGLPEALRHVLAYDPLELQPEDKEVLVQHVAGLLEAHAEKLQTVTWEVKETELVFETDLGGATLAGKIDAIVRTDEGVFVVEHKTASRFDSAYLQSIASDGQVLRYIWAARKLGYPVRGCIYTVAVKSSLRGKKNETPQALAKRLRKDAAEKEVHHVCVRPGTSDVDRCIEGTQYTIESIQQSESTGVWPRFENACRNKYGICPFYEVCMRNWKEEYNMQVPPGFYQKEDAHEELLEEVP